MFDRNVVITLIAVSAGGGQFSACSGHLNGDITSSTATQGDHGMPRGSTAGFKSAAMLGNTSGVSAGSGTSRAAMSAMTAMQPDAAALPKPARTPASLEPTPRTTSDGTACPAE